ncbi:MAG: 16S rRNA (guanine(527)-N(7))-methyltransferase RsmG [Candidatus Promineifilaceae bacterium]
MTGLQLLAEGAAHWGFTLTAAQLAQFAQYQALLLGWNERMNLTAITAPTEIEVRHFLDALSCAVVTGDLNGRRLIDVGTGAGFPGLPLKILCPDMQLTLVDSIAKKTCFLEAVVAALALSGVTILAERAETLGHHPRHREQYDWAVARSVAELRVLVEYLLPLCRVGGAALAQKGESAAAEVAAAAAAIAILGGGAAQLTPVHLPQREMLHFLVRIPKLHSTSAAYPRRVGMPAKKPLQ